MVVTMLCKLNDDDIVVTKNRITRINRGYIHYHHLNANDSFDHPTFTTMTTGCYHINGGNDNSDSELSSHC